MSVTGEGDRDGSLRPAARVQVPREELQRAVGAIGAMAGGDPMGFVPTYIEARDADWEAGDDGRVGGLVRALACLATDALAEIDRCSGEPGAGLAWLYHQPGDRPSD